MDHLKRAKEYLRIAESSDSKKEAYKAAAKEIVAAVAEGKSQRTVATVLGKSPAFVKALLDWQKSGFKADTPWLADEKATSRAALSHAKAVLRDPELRQQALSGMTNPEVMGLAKAATDTAMSRAAARASEHNLDPTAATAAADPGVQMRMQAADLKSARMRDITEGIIALRDMDVEEYAEHIGNDPLRWGLLITDLNEVADKVAALKDAAPIPTS